MKLAQRLKFLRKKKGWTQDLCSKYCGVNRNTIAKIENGTTKHPERTTIERLAHGLGVSEALFLYGVEDKQFLPDVKEILTYLQAMNKENRKKVISIIRVLSE